MWAGIHGGVTVPVSTAFPVMQKQPQLPPLHCCCTNFLSLHALPLISHTPPICHVVHMTLLLAAQTTPSPLSLISYAILHRQDLFSLLAVSLLPPVPHNQQCNPSGCHLAFITNTYAFKLCYAGATRIMCYKDVLQGHMEGIQTMPCLGGYHSLLHKTR